MGSDADLLVIRGHGRARSPILGVTSVAPFSLCKVPGAAQASAGGLGERFADVSGDRQPGQRRGGRTTNHEAERQDQMLLGPSLERDPGCGTPLLEDRGLYHR